MEYQVTRGSAKGRILKPHVHEDECYVASKSRFERDYIRVRSLRELEILARNGFSIRMSDGQSSPSLISPASLGF